jgi:hypothetical protein
MLQILFSVAFVHLLNDCVQAVLPSIYPLLKQEFALSFTQVGGNFGSALGPLMAAAIVVGRVHGIETVYRIASFLPLLGILAAFLPRMEQPRH